MKDKFSVFNLKRIKLAKVYNETNFTGECTIKIETPLTNKLSKKYFVFLLSRIFKK